MSYETSYHDPGSPYNHHDTSQHSYHQQASSSTHQPTDAASQAEVENIRQRIEQLQQPSSSEQLQPTHSYDNDLAPPYSDSHRRLSLSSTGSEWNSETSAPPVYTPAETEYTPSETSQTPEPRYQGSSRYDVLRQYIPSIPAIPSIPSYEIPSRPEIPSYNIPSRPEIPSYEIPLRPEIPAYSIPSRPQIASYSIPSKPDIPAYSIPSKPEIPSYNIPSKPDIPSYNIPPKPDIPSYRVPSKPEIPSYNIPSRPGIPSYEVPSRPDIPAYQIPTRPEIPSYELPSVPPTPSVPGISRARSRAEFSEIPSLPRVPSISSRNLPLRVKKPIAIPATAAQLGSPFLRAYPPLLASSALTPELFLRFIDDLNRVVVASPPLQVLGLAGTITGFVPLATAQIVGNAVSAAATPGTIAISRGRTELYIREANKDIFGPRGLKVEIAKTEALAKITGMPFLSFDGSIEEGRRLWGDLDAEDLHTLSGQQRRLNALVSWIAPLDVTPLPENQQQSKPLRRLSQAASERQRQKGEAAVLKDRKKSLGDGGKAKKEYEKEMQKLEKEKAKVMKEVGKKLERELGKIEKEKAKVERKLEKDTGKGGRDALKDDKEGKAMRKILWLVIRDADADSGSGPDPYTDD